MSSYGRYRNSASSYQFRARPGYASGSFAPKGARRYTPKPAAARRYGAARKPSWKPKFATVAYSRDTETKYSDKAIQGTGRVMVGAVTAAGFGAFSQGWRNVNFGGAVGTPSTIMQQDLLKGVTQGLTASNRIGNKINVKCMKLKITLTGAWILNSTASLENGQYGESVLDDETPKLRQYLRTTYRVLVVQDSQVNSIENEVNYDEVMEADATTGMAGVHSELKIGNMGRFKILTDKIVNLDATDPQKTLSLNYYNLGPVRYNGATNTTDPVSGPIPGPALTDKSIYIVYAAWTQGANTATIAAGLPTLDPVNVSRRLCFTDA